MDGSTITGLAASLSSAVSITKNLLGMQVDDKVRAAVSDIQASLIAAQSSALESLAERESLFRQVRELEQRLSDVEDWKELRQKFVAREFERGAFAYISEDEQFPGLYCPKCLENQRLSRLQETRINNGSHYGKCLQCSTDLQFRKGAPLRVDHGRDWMD